MPIIAARGRELREEEEEEDKVGVGELIFDGDDDEPDETHNAVITPGEEVDCGHTVGNLSLH